MLGSGGTMRLGAYPCKVSQGSLLHKLYSTNETSNADETSDVYIISERHRHRFEFNNSYRETLTGKGMAICGVSPDESLVEAIELPDHCFFTGVQFHPEFKSRPNKPHPLFRGLLEAALEQTGNK
jgi:CTP synthase